MKQMYLKEGPQSFFVGVRPRVGRVSDMFVDAGRVGVEFVDAGRVGVESQCGGVVIIGSRPACLFHNLNASRRYANVHAT